MKGIRIGELLVEQGVLTQDQVDHILKVQSQCARPFGDLAERLYGINPKAVTDAWVEQYIRISGVTDLEEQSIDIDCLRLLSARQAWQFHVLPMHREECDLVVATDERNLVRAVNFATRRLNEPVYLVIARRQQLRDFLMKHYPVPEYVAQFAETL